MEPSVLRTINTQGGMVLILSQREKMMEETLFFLKDKTELAFVTLEWVKGRQHQAVPFFFFSKVANSLTKTSAVQSSF